MSMTASVCPVRCRLHTKFLHHEPCKFCRPSHVQLARSADAAVGARDRRLNEGLATRREDRASAASPSHSRTTSATRGVSDGSAGSLVSPSRTSSSPGQKARGLPLKAPRRSPERAPVAPSALGIGPTVAGRG